MTQRKLEALARAIPGARLEVIRGAGHMTILEQPEAVARLILGFLEPTSVTRSPGGPGHAQ